MPLQTIRREAYIARIDPVKARALPFPDGDFDVVISFQVREYVEDVDSYLKEIRRVQKPGGRLLLTTPNSSLRLLPGQKPWDRFHVREYIYRAIKNTLRIGVPFVEVKGYYGNRAMAGHREIPGKRAQVAYPAVH